ncbi:helix-turn-helix domain-containing protein [Spirillospora sp. NPDC047279]|uniref:helix-turn-helix domain-containing protein n=1 Tax=Spirillospora sp. NPDC047279 TaxID=3155478 RepID=UPI0033E0DBC0
MLTVIPLSRSESAEEPVSGDPNSFGPELRRARMTKGLSLAELSRRTYYSKGYLSKIETGRKPPSSDLALQCDAALDAGGGLAALVPRRSATSARSAVSAAPATTAQPGGDHDAAGDQVWTVTLSPDGGVRFSPVSRRHVLVTGTASLIGLSLPAPAPAPAAARSATAQQEAALQVFRSMFDQFRQLGQTASPSAVLPGLIAQTHALRGMAASAAPGVRSEMLLLASRYAEYTGWMAQESGDDRAALWWTAQAVDMASAGGDPELEVYALVRRALVAFYREDFVQTVALAGQAQAGRHISPRIRGLAAQREAQGHALAGDYDECRRALDRATTLLDGAASPGGPAAGSEPRHAAPLGSKNISDPVAIATGWCYHDLGRSAEAAEILERETARIPRGARRSRARYEARLALAYANAGEVDRACEVAGRVVDETGAVDSATIRLDLARLARTLTRWHGHGSVRALTPQLAHALRTHPA